MNILLVVTSLGVGGAERQVIDLADRFAGKGFNVVIASLLGDLCVRPINPKVNLVSLGGRKSLVGMFFAFFRLLALLREHQPDVVHSHMFHANIFARVCRVFVKVPRLVCTAHSTNEGSATRMALYRLTNFLSDVNTNVSDKAVLEFERRKAVRAGEMYSVANGIDLDRFQYNEGDRKKHREKFRVCGRKVVLSVGRMVEAKNYLLLLEAFSKALRSINTLELWIVGDGPLKGDVESRVSDLGIGESVHLLGVRSDVPEIMSAADIFVLSSSWEGFGLVVAEAMATERVVVATDCGGVSHVLGDCGFLVPKENSDQLASAIIEAVNLSSDEQRELGIRARARVLAEFGLDAIVLKWIKIYEGVD